MATFDVSITPAQIEIIAKPGITLTQAFNLVNNSNIPITMTASVLPWKPVGPDGSLTYDNVSPYPLIEFSLANADIQMGQSFTLTPNQKRQIVLKMKTDPSIPFGDSYHTLFVSQNIQGENLNPEITNSQTFARLGAHILFTTSNTDQITSKAEITKFQISPKIKDFLLTPISFQTEITNLDKSFFKTQGSIVITKNNLKVSELKLRPDNVLADSSREIVCIDNPTCTLKPPFWPGAYTATIQLDPSISAKSPTIQFYIFPFSLIIFLFLLGTGVFLFIYLSKKKQSP